MKKGRLPPGKYIVGDIAMLLDHNLKMSALAAETQHKFELQSKYKKSEFIVTIGVKKPPKIMMAIHGQEISRKGVPSSSKTTQTISTTSGLLGIMAQDLLDVDTHYNEKNSLTLQSISKVEYEIWDDEKLVFRWKSTKNKNHYLHIPF